MVNSPLGLVAFLGFSRVSLSQIFPLSFDYTHINIQLCSPYAFANTTQITRLGCLAGSPLQLPVSSCPGSIPSSPQHVRWLCLLLSLLHASPGKISVRILREET